MGFFRLLLVALVLVGCTDSSVAEQTQPDLRVGEHYGPARERLMAAGWHPVKAVCSPSNMCFEDFPEMATNMETGAVCPVFAKGPSKLILCLNVILDGAKVKSFRVER